MYCTKTALNNVNGKTTMPRFNCTPTFKSDKD